MRYNVRFVTPYSPRRGGLCTFSRHLITAFGNLTGEIGVVRVAAIDNNNGPYEFPVDLTIKQDKPNSWKRAIDDILTRAGEGNNPTVVVLNHEYGLDPEKDTTNDRGNNYVRMAKEISRKNAYNEGEIMTLVYLHTVLSKPDAHQKKTLQDLAKYSDGLIVTTESAIDILTEKYGIDRAKIKKIHHGIRNQKKSNGDRLQSKVNLGMPNISSLFTILGLKNEDKGIQYAIPGYAEAIRTSFSPEQRAETLLVVGGQYHPNLIKENKGKGHRELDSIIASELKASRLNYRIVNSLSKFKKLNFKNIDIAILDAYLLEPEFMEFYTATNGMILPYRNIEQISSGILADTIGFGRVAIATKSAYSVEMLNSKIIPIHKRGIIGIGDPHARGILIDRGKRSIDQIADAIVYLVEYQDDRLRMETLARSLGIDMSQHNSALQFVDYVNFALELKTTPKGRRARVELKDSEHTKRVRRRVRKKKTAA